MRAPQKPSKLPKSPSFWGLCPLDPHRGFAPGPHQGPLSGPLDLTPLYAPLKLVSIFSYCIVRPMLLRWLRACYGEGLWVLLVVFGKNVITHSVRSKWYVIFQLKLEFWSLYSNIFVSPELFPKETVITHSVRSMYK